MSRRPVEVTLSAESTYIGQTWTDTATIERSEWNTLTAQERRDLLDSMAETHAALYVGYGWHIEDPDDYADTEED